ncbi:MAG: FecR domain-containing protein [Saprospiraceae bacterium]|nr:FecR domain-containing protein [Saprospiraceae bacterium]
MEQAFPDHTLFDRWVRDDLSDTERQQLERLPDFPALHHLVENARQQQLSEQDTRKLLTRFLLGRNNRHTRPPAYRWPWRLIGLAVACTLALLIWTLLQPAPELPSIAATATGEQKTVTLPDGSTVRLNAVSSVEILQKNWSAERRVRLLGEAFFQIKKGMTPFVVETDAGSVAVLGTSFSVRYRGGSFDLACYDGFVTGCTPGGFKQALRAGQKVSALQDRWLPLTTLTDPWPSWMQGESRFGDAPVYEVFAELERQYNISISASGIEGQRFSGLFVHHNLPRALGMVCEPLGLQFAVEGRQVLIRKKQ